MYFYFFNGVVYKWKLWGSIYLSTAGVALSLASVLAHFDTIVAPHTWLRVFRDGSLSERHWLSFLLLFWAAAVHVCTSTLSVGESQANVYFTTWIAFGATAMNLAVWRESAGLHSLNDATFYRETTYNWLWIGFFSCIFAGAATDIFYNRSEIVLQFRGETLRLQGHEWVTILIVVWAEVVLCFLAVALNETQSCVFSPGSGRSVWQLPCVVRRPTGSYRCVLGWRQWEGVALILATGLKFWVILEYSSVDGVIPGLSNAYFGLWGSFFNGVFCTGTWLRENKNIAYIARDEEEHIPPTLPETITAAPLTTQ